MIGLRRRLAAQTLSQILFFGLCASPTESIPLQQATRPAHAIREKDSFHDDCRALRCYLSSPTWIPSSFHRIPNSALPKLREKSRLWKKARKSCVGEFKAHVLL